MTVDCLIDTNVLVYGVDASPENASKKRIAMALIEVKDFGLSAQVLQEFYVTVTRKLRVPLPPETAMEFLDRFHALLGWRHHRSGGKGKSPDHLL